MKKHFKSKLVVLLVLVGLIVPMTNCGYLLYPERRGQTTGKIDPGVLIMDCAWLIVFVVPGVVALLVDALAGGLYEGGAAANARPGDGIGFRLKGEAPVDATLEVTATNVGTQREVVMMTKHYMKGEEAKDLETFSVPYDLMPGKYVFAVKVNGVVSQAFNINLNP